MKRVLLTIAAALVIPSILAAAPITMGMYFDGKLTYTPTEPIGEPFRVMLYLVQSEYSMTGVEYSLVTPTDPTHALVFIGDPVIPPGSVQLGDHWGGHSVTYWPPLTGYPDGYDLLVTFECRVFVECEEMWDYPIEVTASGDSGYLRGTHTPDNDFVDIIGLTSYLCPMEIGTEEESWGAIKSMYR